MHPWMEDQWKQNIPEDTQAVVIPLELFKAMWEEAEVGYHGFADDTDMWNNVTAIK